MGKGVIKKHTAKELEAKAFAHKDKGGGAQGIDRRAPKCQLVCKVCKAAAPSLAIMTQHYQAKHPKLELKPDDYPEGK